MQVQLHEAEQCLNELHYTKGPWYGEQRFQVILKWMEKYHSRKKEFEEKEKLIPYPEEGDGMD